MRRHVIITCVRQRREAAPPAGEPHWGWRATCHCLRLPASQVGKTGSQWAATVAMYRSLHVLLNQRQRFFAVIDCDIESANCCLVGMVNWPHILVKGPYFWPFMELTLFQDLRLSARNFIAKKTSTYSKTKYNVQNWKWKSYFEKKYSHSYFQ